MKKAMNSSEQAQVQAVNKRHQKVVNQFLKCGRAYNLTLIDFKLTDAERKRKMDSFYQKAYELFHDLPKREQDNIITQVDNIQY